MSDDILPSDTFETTHVYVYTSRRLWRLCRSHSTQQSNSAQTGGRVDAGVGSNGSRYIQKYTLIKPSHISEVQGTTYLATKSNGLHSLTTEYIHYSRVLCHD